MTANTTNLTSIGLRPGDRIDKYEVIEQIGAGGFSVVWKAYDRLLDKHVAVKQVTVDPSVDEDAFRERFRSEAVIQKKAAQEHRNLVRIIDFIEEPRGLFIIMEHVNGPSLENLLAQNPGPVEVKTALGIAAAAAVALGALHDKGIVHRDLKPANILLPAEGGLKICDFGLASLMADQETPAVGTVRYMAPELLDGKTVDGRADLYSLGIMLYEMLIGRANFEDSFKTVLRDQRNVALRWMKWHTNARIKATPMRQYVPTLPEPIALLVERMIEKDPHQRIASASQLIEAMRRQLANPGTPDSSSSAAGPAAGSLPSTFATPGAVGDKTVRLKKKSKVVLIAAVTVVLWSIVGIGFLLMSQSRKNKEELQRQSVVHADYREALKLFGEEKWDEASLKFKSMLDTHGGYKTLPVPVAGNERKPMETAVAGHLYFCDARREFSMQNYDKTIDLLNKAEAASAIDLGRIDALRKEADILNRIGFKEQAITRLAEEGKFFAAKHEWLKFRSDGFYKFLSEEQQRRWDDLGPKISARQEEAQAQSVLAEAESLAKTNRTAAIALLEDWMAKNPDNPNRMIRAYISGLKGEVDYETAVARGRSAEQRMDYVGAIDSYERALGFNRKVGEEAGLPTKINDLHAIIEFNLGKAAFDQGDMDAAIGHLNKALSYKPDMAQAKALLKQIDSAGQMASVRRQAVAAHQSGEYERAINLWTRLRDEFQGTDATEIAGEIAKAQFQIAVRRMDQAWAGDDDAATLTAIDGVLRLDPGYTRATTLKTLIETRRRIRNLIAAGDRMRTKGEYADAKRELRRAQDVAKTITDGAIREQLLSEATRQLDDVEYLDLYSKAKRDFELGKLDTARANALGAIKTKKTDEAGALLVKIQAALDKKQVSE